jgi:pimeloyl-ACP methyl ester carboxylesterase
VSDRPGTITTPDGRKLAYVERGPADGAPVIFHHGTPGSRVGRHPDPNAYDEAGVRVITFDRPGYGESDPQPGRSVADVAADARALADELGLERFGVAGISGGGPHALACAALLPERVTRAAIVVGAGPSDDPDFDFLEGMTELNVKEFGAALEGREAIEAFLQPQADAMQSDPESLIEMMEAEVPESDRRTMARADYRPIMVETFLEATRQGVRGWADDDLAFARAWGFELADVHVETRLWQGELDVLVPRAHAEYLLAKLPNASWELIPGAGHMLVFELPRVYGWVAGSDA